MPTVARRYILYHCIITPLLFVWYIVPYLMLITGISVFEAGLIFTLSSLISSCMNFIVGKWLDKGNPNLLMCIISIIEGSAYLLYFVGFKIKNILWIISASTLEKLSYGFYPAYVIYEYEAYPEHIREKVYVYHNVLPLISQAITYPVIGYIIGILSPTYQTLLNSLLIIAFLSYISALLPLYWLPRVRSTRIVENRASYKGFVPKGFYPIALTLLLVGFSYQITPSIVLVNLFIKVLGGGLFAISVYEAISGITTVLFSIPLLKVKKEKGKLMVILGLLFMCISNLMLALGRRIEFAFLSSFLFSAGYAIMDPFFMDILFSKIPSDKKGTILGGLAGIRRIMGIITPTLSGYLAQYIAPNSPYLTSAFALFISILLILFFS